MTYIQYKNIYHIIHPIVDNLIPTGTEVVFYFFIFIPPGSKLLFHSFQLWFQWVRSYNFNIQWGNSV